MTERITSFRVAVPAEIIADLRERLQRTRWPEQLPGAGWRLGTDLDALRAIVAYWARRFDWSAQESELNRYPHFLADIDRTQVHTIHVRSPEPNALPLVLLHGWPSTVSEFRHVIGPLTDPVAHGGRAEDAFDLVIPSLPGFGFSGPTSETGWDADRMARAIAELTRRLGIDRYGVFGTDAGAYVATSLGVVDEGSVAGVHLQAGGVRITALAQPDPEAMADMDDGERLAIADLDRYQSDAGGYAARRWAARVYPNIVHWTEMPRGGHFGALEAPDLLADDVRSFFRLLR